MTRTSAAKSQAFDRLKVKLIGSDPKALGEDLVPDRAILQRPAALAQDLRVSPLPQVHKFSHRKEARELPQSAIKDSTSTSIPTRDVKYLNLVTRHRFLLRKQDPEISL